VGATKWLERFEPAFANLSIDERDAIKDFALLWSLFESRVLDCDGCADKIIDAVRDLREKKGLELGRFNSAMEHFRRRYHDGIELKKGRFDALFRRRDRSSREMAEAFVSNTATDEAHILAGLLIIIFRLRNNLFHGTKWADGVRGQFDNFNHANSALMAFMELHR
jgi:hypothetical protein